MPPRRLVIAVPTLLLLMIVVPGGCSPEPGPLAPDAPAQLRPAAPEVQPPREPLTACELEMFARGHRRCFRKSGERVLDLLPRSEPVAAQ